MLSKSVINSLNIILNIHQISGMSDVLILMSLYLQGILLFEIIYQITQTVKLYCTNE